MAVKEKTKDSETLIVVPTKIRVSRSIKLKGEAEKSESSDETIEITKFASPPAVVKFSIPLKMTKDYQSLGIEFGIELPCYPEELDQAADKAYSIVFAKIQSKIPEIQQTLMEISGR